MVKIDSEHVEQVRFVAWFRSIYPEVLIFAIPNGGYRSKILAMKLKSEGVVPGVPDLFIPEWKLFIEMKRSRGGRLSDAQKSMIPYLESIGYRAVVCYGYDHAVATIDAIYRSIV